MPAKKTPIVSDEPTLSQLAMVDVKIYLEHPVLGSMYGWIKLHGFHSKAHKIAHKLLNEQYNGHIDDLNIPLIDQHGIEYSTKEERSFFKTCFLLSHMVTEWDEHFFENDCTPPNVLNVLTDVENRWIYDQINQYLTSSKNKRHFYDKDILTRLN